MANLVTLDDYKLYKKLTKTDSDEVLTQLITSASDMVKTYCGHTFIDYYTTNKVEYFNILQNQDAIFLTEWPTIAVSQVECRTSYLDDYTVLDASKYFVDTRIDTLFYHSGYWPEGWGSVKVTYTGGYAETPEDVKLAVLDLVTHYYKEEYKEKKTLGQATIDHTLTVQDAGKWPIHISRVLANYRNV